MNFFVFVVLIYLFFHIGNTIHANNFAVLVGASKYWFNYRHTAGTLAMYHSLKRLGMPDSNIILMLAEDSACNPRNPRPAEVFSRSLDLNLYQDGIEVDYRGAEVTVENLLRVLTGRHDPAVPQSQRLLTDEKSNVLVYITGHGGDGFLKFQDKQQLTSQDLADAFSQMHEQKRYHEVLFMIDTCQASTMFEKFTAPSIVAIASSLRAENSYAYGVDNRIGLSLADRFTLFTLNWLETQPKNSNSTIGELITNLRGQDTMSTIGFRADLIGRSLDKIFVMDFFAQSKRSATISSWTHPLNISNNERDINISNNEIKKAFLNENRNEELINNNYILRNQYKYHFPQLEFINNNYHPIIIILLGIFFVSMFQIIL